MRHHGWELPYHPLQVVAIAVFVSLAFAFYVFFIPFLGSKVLEYHVIAIFSPLVILVFALYIRCAAANPADPGIEKHKLYGKGGSNKSSSTSLSFSKEHNKKSLDVSASSNAGDNALGFCAPFGCLAVGLKRLICCSWRRNAERSRHQEDLLYCSLCEAEIFKFSKHCRACDKCVDGFDHHCRWINNCIGKKNYRTFVSLMVSGLLLLILQWSVGVFVIVRCMLNRKEFQDNIVSKLGSSFSIVPFVVVVGLCTVLALLATFPLGQLFFFHLILIHKGISTYDYIVAMRERDQLQGDMHSLQSSPVSSVATAVSNVSSLGALQRRPWCTPPRLLVEHQDTLVKDPLGGDIESGGKEIVPLPLKKDEAGKKAKKPVKISPWKLARLNAEDASKAAERAREKSSVLKPVGNDASIITETDSSPESFGRSPGAEIVPLPSSRKTKRKRDISPAIAKDTSGSSRSSKQHWEKQKLPSSVAEGGGVPKHHSTKKSLGSDDSVAPLQLEARSAFLPSTPGSSAIVPSTSLLSPDESESYLVAGEVAPAAIPPDLVAASTGVHGTSSPPATSFSRPWLQRSVSDGYDASGGESADDSEHGRRLAHAWSRLKQSSTFMNRSAVRSVTAKPPPWVAANPGGGGGGGKARFNSAAAANSKIEASILKHVSMGWSAPPPPRSNGGGAIGGNSTEESNSESISQYNSPDRDSDFFSAGDSSSRHLAAADGLRHHHHHQHHHQHQHHHHAHHHRNRSGGSLKGIEDHHLQ
ncbi:probable protein S-acyltransferase 22 [Selaginella moellendorffii]|uniref:probable protein S-acyltransferase 22 n=1 Tax=Selaginella moellendorffii TaxID=88036 RepID=UPI000D1C28D8|nr:probable protein S-acyltransferase 22 [Selaginella moellendorffii]|eukprot:XP_024538144.1 probable protein S-acyltransferase 22 [Selaginella moellendorffii]